MSGAFNGLGQVVNVMTVADIGFRYGPKIPQSFPLLRQCIFNEDEAKTLFDEIEKNLRRSRELLQEDHGVALKQLAKFKDRLGHYSLQLREEESLLASSTSSRKLQFRKDRNMPTDLGSQVQRLEKLAGYTDRFYTEILSVSQKSRAARGGAQTLNMFEDELPQEDRPGLFTAATSWIWGSFSSSSTGSTGDLESQTSQPTNSEAISVLPTPPPEINVSVSRISASEPVSVENAPQVCKVSLVIEVGGIQYIAKDPRPRTIEEAEALCSLHGLATVASVGFDLVRRGSLAEGVHRLAFNPLNGKYSPVEGRPDASSGLEID